MDDSLVRNFSVNCDPRHLFYANLAPEELFLLYGKDVVLGYDQKSFLFPVELVELHNFVHKDNFVVLSQVLGYLGVRC